MTIPTDPCPDQLKRWPVASRHIPAHFDEDSIVLYPVKEAEVASRLGVDRLALE